MGAVQENNTIEEWRAIDSFPGYLVSNTGRVKSLKFAEARLLKACSNGYGYLHVTLANHATYHTVYVHRLVAQLFIQNTENKPQVNHKDGNKLNNNVENLEWVSKSDNIKHAFKTGLQNHKGINHPQAKLTESQVFEILEMVAEKRLPQKEIAKKFGVTSDNINKIKRGISWKHITFGGVSVGA